MNKKARKYYQIFVDDDKKSASIDIYGDITSYPWLESDVSAYNIKKDIDEIEADEISVYINSYGGEVAEALAIYNALARHKASIHTYVDGFACSAASIIFMAGNMRTMGELSLLMIHNCMSYAGYANSAELRKLAEENDKINQQSIDCYAKVANITKDKIMKMMDAETWITAQEAVDYGFATDIAGCDDDDDENMITTQTAFQSIREKVIDTSMLTKQDIKNIMLDMFSQFDISKKNKVSVDNRAYAQAAAMFASYAKGGN